MSEVKKTVQKKNRATEIKRLLSDAKYRMELHELVNDETEKVYRLIESMSVDSNNLEETAKVYVREFESKTEVLRIIMAYGVYFGTEDQSYLWTGILTRLAEKPKQSGSVFLLNLQLYPALLLLYTAGLSSLSSDHEKDLKKFLDVSVSNYDYEGKLPLIISANTTILQNGANSILETGNLKTPLSDHLHNLLKDTLPGELFFGRNYSDLFDEWEVIIAMKYADTMLQNQKGSRWAPVGRFSWRNRLNNQGALAEVKQKLLEKNGWSLLDAGLFGGSNVRASQALEVVEELAKRISWF